VEKTVTMTPMKLLIHPPVAAERLETIVAAAAPMAVINAIDQTQALREIADADALFGPCLRRRPN
jgi:hypothetical protein